MNTAASQNIRKPLGIDARMVRRAMVDSLAKLDPRRMVRNPVMFIVEIGSVLTTVLWIQALGGGGEAPSWFIGSISLWLWLTVLFANFSEAIAEGRGKAQADALRRSRRDTTAKRLKKPVHGSEFETVSSASLRRDEIILAEAGDIIPADGEVIEGIASVDESAITGESAPVIRESGGDRSAVTGGTRVLSDWLVIRVTVGPGGGFLDRMITARRGGQAAEDAERDRAQYFAGGLHDHLPGRLRDAPPVLDLQRGGDRAGIARDDHRAGGAPGLPDPDNDRRPPLGDRHRRHGPHDPPQRDRDLGPRDRGGRRRRRPPARQDRDRDAREPDGHRIHPRARDYARAPGRRRAARLARRRDARGPLGRHPREGEVRPAGPRDPRDRRAVRPVHRPDADERRGHRRRRPLSPPGHPQGSGRGSARHDREAGRRISPRRCSRRCRKSPARAPPPSSSPTAGRSLA